MSSSLKLVKSINGEHYTCKSVFNNYKIRRKCINPELLQNLKLTIEKDKIKINTLLAGSFLAFHNSL